MLRNAVLGVGPPPDGVDGVLAFDLLSAARWSLRPSGPILVLGSRIVADEVTRLVGGSITSTDAWLNARTMRRGLTVQVFVYPLIAGERVSMGIDWGRPSSLDQGFEIGRNAPRGELQMGGWRGELQWDVASLESWALAGGVAPTATLGQNLISDWIVHWFPEREQFRFDRVGGGVASTELGDGEGSPR
jgi:hypothetical protein